MLKKIAMLFMLLLAIPGAGCAQDSVGSGQTAAPQAQAQTGRVATTQVDDRNYRLGAADKVRILVYNEEALSGEFLVSDAGMLSLPLIGNVRAAGRTVADLAKDIETKLAAGYLREPNVSIDVLTYRPFYILGEVNKPGEYPYANGLTVMNAIAKAEGFTYRANKRRVFLHRAGETAERKVELTPDLQVQPGDTIRIGERYF